MSSSDKSTGIFTGTSFSDVVDETCDRLKDKHIQYSIRRIQEMEDMLNTLEQELELFLYAKTTSQAEPGKLK